MLHHMLDNRSHITNLISIVASLLILSGVYDRIDYFKGSFFFNNTAYIKGTVLSSEVISYKKAKFKVQDQIIFQPKVKYEYLVENISYVSERIAFASTEYESLKDAEYYVNKYPKFSTVNVHFVTDDPQFSTLEPSVNSKEFFIYSFFGLLLLLVWRFQLSRT